MSACPFEPPASQSLRRHLLAALVTGVCVLLLAAPTAQARGTAKPAAKFGVFESGWRARSADSITGCKDAKGTVTFKLLAYPLSGKSRNMKPEQAKATLKAYFKRVSAVGLKNISPKKSPKNIRLYEYTYKPAGENARTTHLRVQLKQDKNRLWVLASVTESAKPRK